MFSHYFNDATHVEQFLKTVKKSNEMDRFLLDSLNKSKKSMETPDQTFDIDIDFDIDIECFENETDEFSNTPMKHGTIWRINPNFRKT